MVSEHALSTVKRSDINMITCLLKPINSNALPLNEPENTSHLNLILPLKVTYFICFQSEYLGFAMLSISTLKLITHFGGAL